MENQESRIVSHDRDFFLYRIITDELHYRNKVHLVIKSPTPQILLKSSLVYKRVLNRCQKLGLSSDKDILNLIKDTGAWTEDEDEMIEILPGRMDSHKIAMFENIRRPLYQQNFKQQLEACKKQYNELLYKRHKFDYLTSSGIANFSKWQYIISKCTYHKGRRWEWKQESMYSVLDYYYKNVISDEIIRDICKHQPWSGIWGSKKSCRDIFGRPAANLTQDQHRLIFWSQIYDNVYEQDDCDPKVLLKDDDVFDGWLLYKQRNKKAEQADNFIKNPKVAQAQNIFLPANTPGMGSVKEQAKEIKSLNSTRATNVMKQRFARLDKEGVVRHQDFRDVKEGIYER